MTQKSSGIGPPGTLAGAVCDRARHQNPIISIRMYKSQKNISVRMYIPHSQSRENVSVRMYITHSQSKEYVSVLMYIPHSLSRENVSIRMYFPHSKSSENVSFHMYIPHSQSRENISVRMYIPHSQSRKKFPFVYTSHTLLCIASCVIGVTITHALPRLTICFYSTTSHTI